MADLLPIPKRIAIAVYQTIQNGMALAAEIADFLKENGVETVAWGPFHDDALENQIGAGEFDLLIALGGDGTMLRAGNLSAPLGLPILGINIGRFGFLTEIQRDEWREQLPKLLQGRYWLEERMLLRAEHFRDGKIMGSWHVINEVVVCRGQFVRPIQIKAEVDDFLLTTYVADGLIASTPTGSTAYALAASGPILPPELRNILLIPVAPHLSMDRAIILSEGSGVKMTVHTRHEAVMSIDGHPPIPMLDGDSVLVRANHLTIKFVRLQDRGYFYRNIAKYMEQNPLTGKRE
ncbi:MAG: NAD(+)/NADH kinase [Chloroflexi bacterium]|nr:NAD(+)/NADH kinase [Chloroflexota bacterium]